MGYRVALFAWS